MECQAKSCAGVAAAGLRAGLAIAETLARRDPGNATWQRDLIVSCMKIAAASPAEARARLRQALAIARRLRAAED